jgi:hypothetical protein
MSDVFPQLWIAFAVQVPSQGGVGIEELFMKQFDTFIRHATLVWMDKYFYREWCLGSN